MHNPPPLPSSADERTEVQQGRRMVETLYEPAAEIGMVCLESAPAHMSEQDASPVLALYAEEIGLDLPAVPARRRYAITPDRRCLQDVL
ncbi:hypothetical protein ACGFIV_24435 [Sphaerisporangium sp. NPDC049003]|uniref:hypothetical protein n=1 Tax=Sphaerisporangium sp. NPDC049003 TaxID=3364517 RepID=UPI00371736E6